jgi:hypothetical protein
MLKFGSSLFAINIGAEHFIDLLNVGAFKITAIGIIQLLG